MFHRIIDGTERRFSVAGLWGSGNVVAPRDEASETGYSMWDGHALYGPGRPGAIEPFPLFLATIPAGEFLDRYRELPGGCQIWAGAEVLGAGCEAACTHLIDICPQRDESQCLSDCAPLPRPLIDCLSTVTDCEWEQACPLDAWSALQER